MDMGTAWLIVATLAIVFALCLSCIAMLGALLPPQQRALRELRTVVEELADDVDQVHGRLNERAARQNMVAAREARKSKVDVLAEAEQLVRAGRPPSAPAPADDKEAQLAAGRRFLTKAH